MPSDGLRPDDLPDPSAGWDERATVFAHSFDGYAYLGGVTPQALEERLVEPLRDSLRRAGRVPHAYTVDDLRAVLFWCARADHFSDWSQDSGADEFHLFAAVVDRLRYLLIRRADAGRSTRAGRRHRCPWCGSRLVARIIYGFPAFSPELEQSLESGELALGGRVVGPAPAEFRCGSCGLAFRREWRPGLAQPIDEEG